MLGTLLVRYILITCDKPCRFSLVLSTYIRTTYPSLLCIHEISAVPSNYYGTLIQETISWSIKQPMVSHEMTFMVH